MEATNANASDQHYSLALDLHSTLADMAFCIGDAKACEQCCQTVFANSRMVRIDTLRSHNRQNDAIDLGFEVLGELGERFPRRPNPLHSLSYCLLIKKSFKNCLLHSSYETSKNSTSSQTGKGQSWSAWPPSRE